MKSPLKELEEKAGAAKAASRRMAYLSTEVKNKALHNIANDLLAKKDEILSANQLDYHEAHSSGMNAAMLDRLMLDSSALRLLPRMCWRWRLCLTRWGRCLICAPCPMA